MKVKSKVTQIKAWHYTGKNINIEVLQDIYNNEIRSLKLFLNNQNEFMLDINANNRVEVGEWVVSDGIGEPRVLTNEEFNKRYEVEND